MKKILLLIVLFLTTFMLIGCGSKERSVDLKDTVLYSDCIGIYDTDSVRLFRETSFISVTCFSKITNEEVTITYEQYEDSKDPFVVYSILIDRIAELEEQMSPEYRYVNAMIIEMMLGENFVFASIGETVEGTVLAYDYGYIVIEVDIETEIEIELVAVAPDGLWDLNIYTAGVSMEDPSYIYEGVENGQKITITLQPGFNTFEFDSYSEYDDYDFVIITRAIL